MSYKLIMYWDIKASQDQEYFEFIVREWVPATNRLGLQTIGAWFSVYTRDINQPRIMAEAMTDDLDTMRQILSSSEWRSIQEKLRAYVENYSQKVVEATGDFQM
jgi:hypothetical protein